MTHYPLHFSSTTQTSSGKDGIWQTSSGEHHSHVAIPPEFDGPGGALSPEDLFNHALTNCFIATFKVYAQASKLEFEKVLATSQLIVDLDENKKPVMKRLSVKVQLHGVSQPDKARLLAQKAAKSGFILNSVKTECHFEFEII
jgi:organic hydroperoxide reductase OsmC/OhrA